MGWGYPYGWGLDMMPKYALDDDHNKVKKVKSVTKSMKKEMKPPGNSLLLGIHGIKDIHDEEEADGLE